MIPSMYDPATFAEVASRLSRLLTDELREQTSSPAPRGLRWNEPAALKRKATEFLERAPLRGATPAQVADRFEELAREFLATNNPLHSPHYMGHQVASVVPTAGFFEALGSTTNEASGIYEMGPLPNAVERALVEKLGARLGWKGLDFDAILTHGGSAANLTALLAARNFHCPGSWKEGLSRDEPRPAFLASAESHYSIARAAGIIGMGSHQVIKVPCDDRHKLEEKRLDAAVREAEAQGLRVIGVVGSGCSTSTGSFDRLRPIGEFCRERGLWFHADLAHGGGLLLSERHRALLDGVELADSVTWDAHKMMFVPALCTFLFYRDKRRSFEAFDQDAPYLFDKHANPTLDYDSAVRTLECTKRPLAMALWALWSVYGEDAIAALVDRCVALGSEFHAMLEAAPDFEPLHRPECNILCFRYLPAGERQVELRTKVIRGGRFYITATRLNGVAALRVTLSNPLTTRAHLAALMEEIRALA